MNQVKDFFVNFVVITSIKIVKIHNIKHRFQGYKNAVKMFIINLVLMFNMKCVL